MNSDNIFNISFLPILVTLPNYIFCRLVTIYGKGTVYLNNTARKILLPFSKQRLVVNFYVPVVVCCYTVVAMYLIMRNTPFQQYISTYEFNILCVSLFFIAYSLPMVISNIQQFIVGNVADKILYSVSGLVFIAFTVIGVGNSVHIVHKFFSALFAGIVL